MKKNYHFLIPLKIYPFDVMISIEESDDVLRKRLIKRGNKESDLNELFAEVAYSGRCVALINSSDVVLRLKYMPAKAEMHSVISHEVFHAVVFIMYLIGADLKIQVSDESYAYLIGYITKEIYKNIRI